MHGLAITIGSLTLKCSKCTEERNRPSSRIDPGWADAGMIGPHSTYGYTYLYIVVGFILTTNELLCLTLYEECVAWCVGVNSPLAITALLLAFYTHY